MNRKIYYISNSRLPTDKAHGIQVMNVCYSMVEQGYEVFLLVPNRKNNLQDDPFSYYDIPENFHIKKLATLDLFSLEHIIGPLAYWLQLISFYISCWFYLLFGKRNRIIYTRDYLGAPLAMLGYDVYYECHYLPQSKRSIFFSLALQAKKIIAISERIKNEFMEHGYGPDDVLLAPDGVDLNKFVIDLSKTDARDKLSLPFDKKLVVYTGHLYGWKGVDKLAEAAGLLEGAAVYFVGGSDKDISKFSHKYKNLIEKGQIVMVRHQAHKLIPVWLKAADVLVLPNTAQHKISRLYTSPLKLFEYMASQRPIVASQLPSLDRILNEKNCLFAKPDDKDDLAKQIKKLLADENLASILADQAYQEVSQYSWAARAEKILNFID